MSSRKWCEYCCYDLNKPSDVICAYSDGKKTWEVKFQKHNLLDYHSNVDLRVSDTGKIELCEDFNGEGVSIDLKYCPFCGRSARRCTAERKAKNDDN